MEERREEVGAWKKERGGLSRRPSGEQNGFLLFRNYRDVGSLGGWGPPWWRARRRRRGGRERRRAEVAAVGRKFKIEYLASNFHRSSKNHAASCSLAGGSASHPPRVGGKRSEAVGQGRNGQRRKRREEGSPPPLPFSPRCPPSPRSSSRIGHAVRRGENGAAQRTRTHMHRRVNARAAPFRENLPPATLAGPGRKFSRGKIFQSFC